jgi:heme/copper-type cytochrome/quinol oxidase subunit 3
MTFALFKGPIDMRRFPEIEDNQDYWHFVVAFWIVVYILIYWLTRWLEVSPW